MSLKSAWNAISAVLTGRDASGIDSERIEEVRQAGTNQQQAVLPDPMIAVQGRTLSPAGAHPGIVEITGDIDANSIEVGDNVTLTGTIEGRGNLIRIAGTQNPQTLYLHLFGHHNEISIGANSHLQNLRLEIGSRRWLCSRARLKIGDRFSIASQARFILPNSGNVLEIGDNCMFSSNIVVRGGEYPHLIFEQESGEYLDVSQGIFIGDHVWVGEGAFIGKSVTLPDDCIIGTRSVVTKRFAETHCVIAGNPSRIVKRGVQWIANEYMLEDQYPIGHQTYTDTRTGQINRAEREQTEARSARSTPVSSAPVDPD